MTDRIIGAESQACPHGRGHNRPCPECRKHWDEVSRELDALEAEAAAEGVEFNAEYVRAKRAAKEVSR